MKIIIKLQMITIPTASCVAAKKEDRVRLGRRRSRIVGASPLARSQWSPGTVKTITPKSGPFWGVSWMSQNGIFCPKTHFPENQRSWPQALWELACESGSEFYKHPRMCERGEWRKQLRDFITQSLKQTHLGSATFSRIFWSNGDSPISVQ